MRTDKFDFRTVLQLIRERSNMKVLASPMLVVGDHSQAAIQVSNIDPIPQIDASSLAGMSSVAVQESLNIQWNMLRSGILMWVAPEITESGSSVRCTTLRKALILTLAEVINESAPVTPVFTPSAETFNYFCNQSLQLFGNDSGMLDRIAPPFKRLKTKGLLYSIESEFLEQAIFKETGEKEDIVTKVLEYVAENFRNNVSLHGIAEGTGYNYQYLSRIFNHTMGTKFKKLLNQYRLEYALYIICDTDRPITEIAFESGFQSVRSLNRVCLETFGCSPMELRKRNKKIN